MKHFLAYLVIAFITASAGIIISQTYISGWFAGIGYMAFAWWYDMYKELKTKHP